MGRHARVDIHGVEPLLQMSPGNPVSVGGVLRHDILVHDRRSAAMAVFQMSHGPTLEHKNYDFTFVK